MNARVTNLCAIMGFLVREPCRSVYANDWPRISRQSWEFDFQIWNVLRLGARFEWPTRRQYFPISEERFLTLPASGAYEIVSAPKGPAAPTKPMSLRPDDRCASIARRHSALATSSTRVGLDAGGDRVG